MTDADMMIEIVQGNAVQIWDMWSVNHDTPVNDTSIKSCTSDLIYTSGNVMKGVATVVFTRKLDTGDVNCDFLIPLDTTIQVCYARLGRPEFDEHNVYGSGTAVIGQNKPSSLTMTQSSDFDEESHAVSLLVAWVCAAPLAVFTARYLKRYWIWYWVHSLLGTYALITTYAAGVLAFKNDTASAESLSGSNFYHFRLGMTVLYLVLAQSLLGLVLKLWVISNTPKIAPLRGARSFHMILGWVLTILGLIACYYGLDIYSTSDLPILYAAYGVLGVWFLAAEGNQRWFHIFSNKLRGRNTRVYHYDDFPYRGKQSPVVVFCDQWVLDIGGFISSHPGGGFLLQRTITEDVGKYLTGNSGFAGDIIACTHSKYARILAKQHRIGRIPYQDGIIIGNSSPATYDRMTWQLCSRTAEADQHIVRFSFSILNHKAVNYAAGVEWIGKHFRLTATIAGRKVRRYYSLVLCLTPKARTRWIASAQSMGQDLPSVPQQTKQGDTGETECVELVVKRYDQGVFSSFIHAMKVGEEVEARGPLGPGLRLTKTSTGKHLALAAGTGVLPFLDLVHFLWWKEANSPDYISDPSTLAHFSLHLVLFLRTRSEAIGLDLLEATHAQCVASQSKRFTLTLSVDQPKPEKEEMVAGLVGNEVRRVWICGPAGFNTWGEDLVAGAGLDRSLIYPF